MKASIPTHPISQTVMSHPWVNDRYRELVREKIAVAGTDNYAFACEKCSRGFFEEYLKYVKRTQQELSKLPRGSKLWWKMSRRLLLKLERTSSIPPLKKKEGEWVLDAFDKAELIADVLSDKWDVPLLNINSYTAFPAPLVHPDPDGFILLRRHKAQQLLSQLSENSATGPDGIGTKVLRLLSRELSLPIAKLIRRILDTSEWPEMWMQHWICPLFKRGSVFDPDNYRGVHLTS